MEKSVSMSPGPGRPRQFDPDEVLETVKDTFWANGYEATSLDALVEATGVPRQSLYNAFGDKRALFERAVERYGDTQIRQIADTLDAPGDPLGNLDALLTRFEAAATSRDGCLIVNELGRLSEEDAELRKKLRGALRRIEGSLVRAFERAIDDGRLSADVSAAARGRATFTILQGLAVLSKAGLSRREASEIVAGARVLLR